MREGLPSRYDPGKVEKKLYARWEKEGYFEPVGDSPYYVIPMPPPNITGALHMGHALNNTLQDILIRWKRMEGYTVLWLPGTDHASIATEARVVEALAREGKSKKDLGREAFLARLWEWREKYGRTITYQLRKLGCSCDWSRERFTMDEGLNRAVVEVFKQFYQEGLIYRGDYIVNWCPSCETTLSDIEVEHKDHEGKLYYIAYPLAGEDGEIIIATTRPETMLGDTGVAVNPEDKRYEGYAGKKVVLPLMEREIPVISDSYVDPEFGTGALKITPGHDPNDFEIGERRQLETVNVIDEKGMMTEAAKQYQGLDRYECREKVIEDLKKRGLLRKVDDYPHSVGHCYRCDSTVEPLVSRQWFVRMKPLAKPAIRAVEDGQVRFVPPRFARIYLRWMEEIRDWCISRQLWWGHRIPVWYCQDCQEEIVHDQEPASCPECGSNTLVQDPDVLDTWFSSALWPFSTLGWPEKTEDLERFFPASVLVTGRDIIFFWVARMIFSSLKFMGEVPFQDVVIHGMVRNAEGKTMSKSLGTGVDPLDVIEDYGADALRFALLHGITLGNDTRFRPEKLEASRNFTNKLWNAARFILMNTKNEIMKQPEPQDLASRWILSRLQGIIVDVTRNLNAYRFSDAAQAVYDFTWSEFCDWYIELAKSTLYSERNEEEKDEIISVLHHVFQQILHLLHPVMPFVSEEIWLSLPGTGETLMKAPWPEVTEKYVDQRAEEDVDMLKEIIRAIRNMRQEMDVPPGRKITAVIAGEKKWHSLLVTGTDYIKDLAGVSRLLIGDTGQTDTQHSLSTIIKGIEIYLPLADMLDLKEEKNRLEKQKAKLEQELKRVTQQLNNRGFVEKAPARLVEAERQKEKEYQESYEKVCERLQQVNSALKAGKD